MAPGFKDLLQSLLMKTASYHINDPDGGFLLPYKSKTKWYIDRNTPSCQLTSPVTVTESLSMNGDILDYFFSFRR
jgi:hypothetical protein